MMKNLRAFFDTRLQEVRLRETSGQQDDHALRMATATLLVEMVRADHQVLPNERKVLLASLVRRFGLDDSAASELLQLAQDQADHATSLHQFTRTLNQHLDHADKIHMVELLWDVALADGAIDKHEDYLVRKVAELIYVPHHEFIRAKHRAEAKQRPGP